MINKITYSCVYIMIKIQEDFKMARKIHNKDTMSTNDKMTYKRLKELLKFADENNLPIILM